MLSMNLSTFIRYFICITLSIDVTYAACSSCLISSVAGAAVAGAGSGNRNGGVMHGYGNLFNNHHHKSAFLFLSMNRLSQHVAHRIYPKLPFVGGDPSDLFLKSADQDENGKMDGTRERSKEDESVMGSGSNEDIQISGEGSKPVTAGMVGAIGFYKNFISPLLPPACRFLPTCSQYGVQAIEEFGPEKGLILTAWRLMRCSPFGGKGYDPPKWPPVAYTYGSY